MLSLPLPPNITSLPAIPSMVSLPPSLWITSEPLAPLIASSSPVPRRGVVTSANPPTRSNTATIPAGKIMAPRNDLPRSRTGLEDPAASK